MFFLPFLEVITQEEKQPSASVKPDNHGLFKFTLFRNSKIFIFVL